MTLAENKLLLFLILLGLALLLFGQILNNEFWTAAEYEYLAKSLTLAPDDDYIRVTTQSHPLVNLFHRIEYVLFGDKPAGYYLLNIFIHVVNAFLLFLLIHHTLKDFGIAFISAVLFVFTVGNYGKEVMYAAGVSGIMMNTVFLLTVMFYIMNETHGKGRILSFWFVGTLAFFAMSTTNRFAFLSGIGVLLAYNIFFKKERGRPVFAFPLVLLLVMGVLLAGFQWDDFRAVTRAYPAGWGLGFFLGNFFSNIPGYLIHMVYPLHYTELVQESSLISTLYGWSVWIRPLLGIIIFSYAAYGFVFGNTNLRFFIAWTFLTILPFCFFYTPGDWLNTKYLYLASAGLCLTLATGTMKMYRVLISRGWRRLVPMIIPLGFILMSFAIVNNLDKAYEERAKLPETQQLKAQFLELKRQSLELDNSRRR